MVGRSADRGLVVHRAPTLDALADGLVAGLAASPAADPFAPVELVVQTGGVARWLRERLALAADPGGRGIVAGVRLPFLTAVVDGLVAATEGRAELGPAWDAAGATALRAPLGDDPWRPARLVWAVLDVVEDATPGTERLGAALRTAPGGRDGAALGRRGFELAREVADVLDRAIAHGPDLLRAWSVGDDVGPDGAPLDARDRWQPALWRALVARHGDPVARADRAVALLAGEGPLPGPLPPRLRLFGFEVLQARHLDLMAALATRVPVDLHLVTPSPARWHPAADASDVPPRPRHPLLVSSGRAAERTLGLVRARAPEAREVEVAGAAPSRPGTLLDRLQSGVRDDVGPPVAGEPPALVLERDDDSVGVHVCHGLARQAEVLRDVLLGLFDRHPHLEPRDVLIIAPDVEAAASALTPALAAVEQRARLPLVVADRELGRTNEVGAALAAILALVPARATASQVVDLVARPVVARRLGLDGADLVRLSTLVDELGIRWGIDEHHRAAQGQPADRAHTWRAGLDRLLLGVAMADEDDRVVGDVAPYDHTVGDEVDRAGRIAAACEAVFATLAALDGPRDGPAWLEALEATLAALVEVERDDAWLVDAVRAGLAEDLAGVARAIEVGVVAGLLDRRLREVPPASGYATGAMTLCAPIPLRSVPSRIVCLLGFDDATFPPSSRAPGYDLVATRGIHDPRDDARLLLLDAVLAAREHLVVTVTGRDARTNEALPPAVPISELVDVLVRLVGEDAYRRHVEVVHPLQPWSPRAFAPDARVRSHDALHLEAARCIDEVRRVGRRAPALVRARDAQGGGPGGRGPASDPDAEAVPVVRVDELARVLRRPLAEYLEAGLGVRVEEVEGALDDEEPLELDGLERYLLVDEVLARGGRVDERWVAAALARQTLPVGTPGRMLVGGAVDDARRVAEAADTWAADVGITGPARAIDVDVELDLGGGVRRRLVDRVEAHEVAGGLVVVVLDASRSSSEDRLLAPWVRHLALTAAAGVPVRTAVVRRTSGSDAPTVLASLADDAAVATGRARDVLVPLLVLRERARHEPLPLLRNASRAFAVHATRGAARSAFDGGPFASSDLDRAVELVTEAEDLDGVVAVLGGWEAFADLAQQVWRPLLDALGRDAA